VSKLCSEPRFGGIAMECCSRMNDDRWLGDTRGNWGKRPLCDLYSVGMGPAWSEDSLFAAERDAATGLIEASRDPRGIRAEVLSPAARC
jgi:hypothetical protein